MSRFRTKQRPQLPPADTVATSAATYGETADFLPLTKALFVPQTDIYSWACMGTWQMVSRTEPFVRVHSCHTCTMTFSYSGSRVLTCDVQASVRWLQIYTYAYALCRYHSLLLFYGQRLDMEILLSHRRHVSHADRAKDWAGCWSVRADNGNASR